MVTYTDGVVDAWIHEAWCDGTDHPCPACVGELAASIAAALHIHRPCHTDPTAAMDCRHTHRVATTTGTTLPVCVRCLRQWPCDTARALGATR